MPQFLSPICNDQLIDVNGDPLVGGQIETYLAGSTTPAQTYTDDSGSVPQSNPIILNSLGYAPNPIWLTGGVSYKFVIKNAAGVVQRTVDDIAGVNDASVSQSEWVESGLVATYINGTSFSVPGDQTTVLQIGRRVRTTNTSGLVYSTISNSVFAAGITTVTLLNDFPGALDPGLSLVAYGLLSASPSSIPPKRGGNLNEVINGAFQINQRSYVSGAATVAGQYTFDRWKVTGTGGITFSTANNKTTVTIPVGQTMQQVIEGLNIQTDTYVLSWEGTAQGRINSGAYGVSGSVTASLTGGANTTLEFNSGTVTRIQLEPGTVASPFEQRLIGQELALCQRYYQNVTDRGFVLENNAPAVNVNNQQWPVQMRASPTLGLTIPSGTGGTFEATATGFKQSGVHSAAVALTAFTASAEL